MEECENIRWYTDSDDGNDSLINALDGDEDEACEFKMMFADLCAECEQMSEDLNEEWVPECFDIFFVAAGAGEDYGGLLGYDSYEGDYFGLNCTDAWAEDETKGVVASFGTDGDRIHVLYLDGIVNSYRKDKDIKKTGRHIDIAGMLKQIGGNE